MAESPVLQAPSPSQIREEIQAAVLRDLLGPAGGPEEEVDERGRVSDRYLVGMLAPRRQVLTQETFDDLAVGGAGTPEEGNVDVGAPQATTMFPSSFGLSFCVDGTASQLQICARWGFYDRVASDTLKTPAGDPRQVWKRRPIASWAACGASSTTTSARA